MRLISSASRRAVREAPYIGWISRLIAGRPRLFFGVVCGLAAYGLMPQMYSATARTILAWDFGVAVFLGLTAILFLGKHQYRMAADAERQQEGEWTVFTLTVAGIAMSVVAIIYEFSH